MTSILTLNITKGLGAKVAQEVVNKASEFESDATLSYKGKKVDLKSILGIMSLAVLEDEGIEIVASGNDALELINAIRPIVEKK